MPDDSAAAAAECDTAENPAARGPAEDYMRIDTSWPEGSILAPTWSKERIGGAAL